MKLIPKDRKKIFIACVIMIVIVTLSTLIVKHVDKRQANLNPELLRSMNYIQVTDDGKVDNTDFVKFSAFFTRDLDGDGNAEKLLGTCRRVNEKDQLYIDLNVLTNGYLRDGVITINSTNFKYSMSMIKDNVLKNNYISDDVKRIELNQVNAGTQKLIIGNILSYIGNDTNNYSVNGENDRINSITLTGTHVSDEGVETPISKTIDLIVDWHGETKANIRNSTVYYNYDELETQTVSFNFTLEEMQKELILKESEAIVTIPKLNGYAPTEVKCTNSNIESEYNSETKELKIKRSSICNDKGIITSTLSRSNSYTVEVTYPKEAYEPITAYTTLTFSVQGYYTGYNNTNKEFTNPYKSNIANGKATIVFREKPKGEVYNFYVDFVDKKYVPSPINGNIISKQEILNSYDHYNEENENDDENAEENKNKIQNKEYIVRWRALRGPEGEVSSIIMSETKEGNTENAPYGDKWSTTIMQDYVTNTGIYFEDADQILEEDGTISVYNNDTNELIHTFTKEEWNNYTRQNPYKYENSVRHIRIETSKAKSNATLGVCHIKELETEKILKDFTKEQVKDVEIIYTYLTGICIIEEKQTEPIDRIDYTYFVYEKSESQISLQTYKLPTQEKQENQSIYINTIYQDGVKSKWKNGEFLVEIPKEIINMDIKNVSTNNNNVKIVAYDLYKKDDKYFIKIITENENPESYRITIDCTMTPDPRAATSDKQLRLYSYNEYCNEYYYEIQDRYDVDGDNKTNEKVGTSITNIELLSPTSLITLETITDYDNTQEDEITIAPNVADVIKEAKEATINVSLTNNYSNIVSGVQILGKIPFEGNTYILNENELGSDFTTTMKSEGIILPKELEGKAIVYYSENENPNKNLEDSTNGWTVKENVQDFSKVKAYLIDLGQNTIDVGKSYTFNYIVNIPEGIDYNLVSYSDHAVYYELDTEGGKLQLNTEPSKVGLRIVRKYGLELTKNKENFENLKVAGATYKVEYTDFEGNERARLLTTNSEGYVSMEDLYVGITYKVTEIRAPENYVLDNETIEFKVIEDENENLKIETSNPEKVVLNGQDEKVEIKTEDEPKYNITITKTDENTGENLYNVRFRCGDKIYRTDRSGQITIERLELNKEYTLTEEKAKGYYLIDAITFKVVKDEHGNLKVESNNAGFTNATIQNSENEDLIQVSNINITNEKIPTYSLQILKVAENEKEEDISKLTPLKGAKFKFESVDLNSTLQYYTDDNGTINIEDLYQYVEGKNITGKYKLQELESPEGYSNNLEEIQFRVIKTEENELKVEIENEENLKTIKDIQIEENTIKMIIQDQPLFKLTKTDSKTGEVLANAKFIIYEIDETGEEIDFAKDVNGNYVGELNEIGQYVVTTDETGTIILPLKSGKYKIVEIGYPEGYLERKNEETFQVAGGNGEDSDIEIDCIEDLVKFSNNVNYGINYKDRTIKLMRALDFEEDESYRNPEDTSYGDLNGDGELEGIKAELTDKDGCGFTPIGKGNGLVFSGTFDGQSYEIRNLYINSSTLVGLFGYVENGKIKNIGIVGAIGGIAGYVSNSSISNCYNTGDVSSNYSNVGGIAGYVSNSSISNCYNTGNVIISDSNSFAGGIAGYISNSSISNCYNTGDVSCSSNTNTHAGGIAGSISNSNISNCYNVGDIRGYDVGGITAGYVNDSSISNCYYLDSINIIESNIKNNGTAINEMNMKTEEFVERLGIEFWKKDSENKNNGYPILEDKYRHIERINYIEDLQELSNEVNSGNWYIERTTKLERNLNFEEDESYRNPEDTSYGDLNGDGKIEGIKAELTSKDGCGFTPIGKGKGLVFSGTFDGQGYEIQNLYINIDSSRYVGLFGYVESAEIKNIRIAGDVSSSYASSYGYEYNYAGGIAGYVSNSSISDCYNTGFVSRIINNRNPSYAGGVAGYVTNSNVSNCYNTGDVSSSSSIETSYAGGIAGYVTNSSISNCYNTGDVSSMNDDDSYVGGVAGYVSNSSIRICYNTGDISSSSNNNRSYAGGIAGDISNSSICNCYNTGKVHSSSSNRYQNYSSHAGGIAGYVSNSSISNCYNTGDISSSNNNNRSYAGGIAGYISNSSICNCYYLDSINIIGDNTNNYGDSVIEIDMKTENFVKRLGVTYWKVDNENRNNGYPILEDKYRHIESINYIEDLQELSNGVNNGDMYIERTTKLERNLNFEEDESYRNPEDTSYGDLNGDGKIEGIKAELTSKDGCGFTPIGKGNGLVFSGTFEGQGYEIQNLYINIDSSRYSGLFGYVENGEIKNIGIMGDVGNSNNNSSYAGGIVGYVNNGNISNCYNTGDIINIDNSYGSGIGGIAGNVVDGRISRCYNTGSVSGNENAGGIAGYVASSDISNCYNSGNINSGEDNAGGISGDLCGSYNGNSCSISNCYNMGNVSGKIYIGGITGHISDDRSGRTTGKISNCYNIGDISSSNRCWRNCWKSA